MSIALFYFFIFKTQFKKLNLLVAPPSSIGLLCICDNAANPHKRMPGMLQLMKRDILIFSVV